MNGTVERLRFAGPSAQRRHLRDPAARGESRSPRQTRFTISQYTVRATPEYWQKSAVGAGNVFRPDRRTTALRASCANLQCYGCELPTMDMIYLRPPMVLDSADPVHTFTRLAPLKVAMFAPSMTWGGAEKMFKRLAVGFAAAGLCVDLVLVEVNGPNLQGLPAAVRVIDLKCRRVLSSVRPLARYLEREKPDVLLSTLYYANLAAVWARSLTTVSPMLILREATTVSAAAANSGGLRSRAIPTLVRLFYPRADVVVANSRGAARDLIDNVGVPRSMVRVIHNPSCGDDIPILMREIVSHPWFGDGGPPIVLSAGRLSPPKRFDLLIRAVCAARQQRPLRLVILGDGEERDRLESLLDQMGARDYVSLPGSVDNPYAYMAKAALFVLSSAWEGLPNALIEAMACGLPVVSTDCPSGPREILETCVHGPGHLGSLVRPNDVDGMAQAILHELESNRDRDMLKQQASKFRLDRAVTRYIDLMETGRRR